MINRIFDLYKKYKEIVLYLIFGGLTTLVNLVTYFVCSKAIGISWQISNVIAWTIAVLFAYFTNRKMVFESKNSNVIKELISFMVFRLISFGFDMGFMYLFVDVLSISDVISKFIVQILVIIINYVFSKFIIFKK